jgi:hypothetical protein
MVAEDDTLPKFLTVPARTGCCAWGACRACGGLLDK